MENGMEEGSIFMLQEICMKESSKRGEFLGKGNTPTQMETAIQVYFSMDSTMVLECCGTQTRITMKESFSMVCETRILLGLRTHIHSQDGGMERGCIGMLPEQCTRV